MNKSTFKHKCKTSFHHFFHQFKRLLNLEFKSKEELIHLVKESFQQGIINPETYNILENTINLNLLQVRDIMTPKSQMVYIQENADLDSIVSLVTHSGHSRFPVLSEHGETILGILHAKDLLRLHTAEYKDLNLHDLVRTANFVPESKPLDVLLSDFKKNRNHMALVVDEYGQIIGFVTIEDTIEQIIGDIADEFDVDEEDPIKFLSAKQLVIKGDTEIDVFNQRLNAQLPEEQFDTIAGLVTMAFGYPPKRGEEIKIQAFKFKILSASARHIKLLECTDLRHIEKLDNEDMKL